MANRKPIKYVHDERLPAFVATQNFFNYGTQRLLIQVLTLNLNSGSMRCRFFDPDTHELKFGQSDIPIQPFLENFNIVRKN